MKAKRVKSSSGAQRPRVFMSASKIMTAAVFAILAMAAVPSLHAQRQRDRLTDGVSLLSRYAVDMESFYLNHGRYDNARSGCGVLAPASTKFLSFSCRTDGETYVATVRGVGALEGYEYVLDDSLQPRKTVRFAGTTVHKNCWLRTASSCYG